MEAKKAQLNIHSHYSMLRGVNKLDKIVKSAKEKGYDALALTDNCNIYGSVDFFKVCKEEGVKPIFGSSLLLDTKSNICPKLILLAKNDEGYKNLLKLITIASFNRNEKTLPKEMLSKYKDNLIAILPPLNNELVIEEKDKNNKELENILDYYRKTFKDNIYYGTTNQFETPKSLENLIKDLPKVPCPLIYYVNEEERKVRDVILKIQSIERTEIEEDVFDIDMSLPHSRDLNKYTEEEQKNLEKIVNECNFEFEFGNNIFPNPIVEEGVDKNKLLREKVYDSMENKGIKATKEIEERIEYELSVIFDKGYTDYFLVVIDFIEHMHSVKILTTTRGSSAGSLVAYLTGITNVDPIKYQLPFERFLNPFRPSSPDIDIDIADDKRDQVIEYATKRYGKDKLSQIGTFGTMLARAVVRDVSRALGYSYLLGDRIAKMIPFGKQGFPMTIEKAFNEVPELPKLYKENEDVKKIIDVSRIIEGNVRHISTHAAGIVISPEPLVNYTALEKEKGGKAITQLNMYSIEDIGLLKFDFLGLSNLKIISDTIEMIKERTGKEIDLEEISLEDKEVFEFVSKGYTTGLFQIGASSGISRVVKKMKPTNIYDIAVIIALYRPGPMRNIDEYILRKHGDSPIKYIHPNMKKYLENSYGVLVFQDDLLYTAIELAGYNWKEVDVFRKAVGKKIPELMAEQEKIFKERVIKHSGISKTNADNLWKLFDPFKGYGFNKAHALSYAKVTYYTAYLKKYYPAEYMSSHINALVGDNDKVTKLVSEAKKIGLDILPLDIQKSELNVSIEEYEGKKALRIGFSMVKDLGESLSESIVKIRNEKGSFENIEDFIIFVSKKDIITKQGLTSLIKIGAFDSLIERDILYSNIDRILEFTKDSKGSKTDQNSLFGSEEVKNSKIELVEPNVKITPMQKLFWEKEILGIYATGHPLRQIKKSSSTIKEILSRKENNLPVMLTGVISSMKAHKTKLGKKMYFIALEGEDGEIIESVCFPDVVQEYSDLLATMRPVNLSGKTSIRNDEVTLKVEKVTDVEVI